MSEKLTFENYSPTRDGLEGIYDIGANDIHSDGVAREIAVAFDYELTSTPDVENLGGLIGKVGQAKELQENIAGVREVLGTDEDAVSIARSWAESSGFLIPVERSFSSAEDVEAVDIDLVVITGGVRNWMERRANRLIELKQERNITEVLLAGGNRTMKVQEGAGVEDNMTEADYMQTVIAPRLGDLGISAEVLRVDSGSGNEVMQAAVDKSKDLVDFNVGHIAVVSNAGAWVQNAGQYLRAVKSTKPVFDMYGSQLEVVSDSFELGTGSEPTSTHQNPFSAAGQIVRNLQEFTRHAY